MFRFRAREARARNPNELNLCHGRPQPLDDMFGTLTPEPIAEIAAPARVSTRAAYLMMLASSLLFAGMSACSHAAGERCDWRLTAIARAGLVLVFSFVIAKAARSRLVWLGS